MGWGYNRLRGATSGCWQWTAGVNQTLTSAAQCGELGAQDVGGVPHQDVEEDLLKVFCVFIRQPTRILLVTFSPGAHNFDFDLAWKAVWVVRRGRLGAVRGSPALQAPSRRSPVHLDPALRTAEPLPQGPPSAARPSLSSTSVTSPSICFSCGFSRFISRTVRS